MPRHPLLTLVIGLGVLAGAGAWAATEPVDGLGCNSMDITPVMSTEELSLSSWSLKGILIDQSDRGDPDISTHCVGMRLTHGDQITVHGYCTMLYPNGDRTVSEVSRDGEAAGNWRLIDGTGKYAGATGEGTYQFITKARPVQEGTWQYCSRVEGSITLKE